MREKRMQGQVTKDISVNIIFRTAEDGSVTAECVEIPGCSVMGKDEDDAKVKIKAAVEGCLDALLSDCTSNLAGSRVRTASN